jgi:hypothetical protein
MSQVAYLHIGRERLVGKPYNFTYNCQISAMPVAGLDEVRHTVKGRAPHSIW